MHCIFILFNNTAIVSGNHYIVGVSIICFSLELITRVRNSSRGPTFKKTMTMQINYRENISTPQPQEVFGVGPSFYHNAEEKNTSFDWSMPLSILTDHLIQKVGASSACGK